MAEIKIGDLVKVLSLQKTVKVFGYDDVLVPIGSINEVADYDEETGEVTFTENTFISYHEDDLEVLNKVSLDRIDDREECEDAEVTLKEGLVKDLDGDVIKGQSFRLDECHGYNHGYNCEWCEVFNEDDEYYCLDLRDVYIDLIEEDEEDIDLTAADTHPATYIITEEAITLNYQGRSDTVTVDQDNFTDVLGLILQGNYSAAQASMNPANAIEAWGQGLLDIDCGEVVYNGMTISNKLTTRILEMMKEGDDSFERFAKCLTLTMEQESYKTRERIMDFVSCGMLEIDENGYVIAFKNVDSNFKDHRTHKFDNSVGASPSMPRSEVDDDHNNTCSNGLHVCSPQYLRDCWGTRGKTLKVIVDPRDFVAIPFDYNDSKARVCKYTVVEDVTDQIGEYLK